MMLGLSDTASNLRSAISAARASGDWSHLPGISDVGFGQCSAAAILRTLDQSAQDGTDPQTELLRQYPDDAGYYTVCEAAFAANGFPPTGTVPITSIPVSTSTNAPQGTAGGGPSPSPAILPSGGGGNTTPMDTGISTATLLLLGAVAAGLLLVFKGHA